MRSNVARDCLAEAVFSSSFDLNSWTPLSTQAVQLVLHRMRPARAARGSFFSFWEEPLADGNDLAHHLKLRCSPEEIAYVSAHRNNRNLFTFGHIRLDQINAGPKKNILVGPGPDLCSGLTSCTFFWEKRGRNQKLLSLNPPQCILRPV